MPASGTGAIILYEKRSLHGADSLTRGGVRFGRRRFCLHGRRSHRASSGGLPSGRRCSAPDASRRSGRPTRPPRSGGPTIIDMPSCRGGGATTTPVRILRPRPAKPDRRVMAASTRGSCACDCGTRSFITSSAGLWTPSPARWGAPEHRTGGGAGSGLGAATPSGVAPAATRGNARAAARRTARPGGPMPSEAERADAPS